MDYLKSFRMIAGITALLVFAACATPPDKIQTSYVSALEFKDYECDQLASELRRKNRRLSELFATLKGDADADEWQMGLGLILFWPTLFFLEGGDDVRAQEYSRLKGEVEAMHEVATSKKCELG